MIQVAKLVLVVPAVVLALAVPGNAYNQQLYEAINSGRGDSAKVKKLLSGRKINVNSRGQDGTTPLMDACYTSNHAIAKLLIEAGAGVNATDNFGNTALMLACGPDDKNIQIARLLIDKGANVSSLNENGLNAVGWARRNGFNAYADFIESYHPSQPSKQFATKHVKIFLNRIHNEGKDRFVDAAKSGPTPDLLVVTVKDIWHYQPYQVRYQAAQALWKDWLIVRTGIGDNRKDADSIRIMLVDRNGNEVGGSRVLAGSLIWVSK